MVACLTIVATTVSAASIGPATDRAGLDGHVASAGVGGRRRSGGARRRRSLSELYYRTAFPGPPDGPATCMLVSVLVGVTVLRRGRRHGLLHRHPARARRVAARAGGDGGPRAGAGLRAGAGRRAHPDRAGDARRPGAPDLAGRPARGRAGLPGRPHPRGDRARRRRPSRRTPSWPSASSVRCSGCSGPGRTRAASNLRSPRWRSCPPCSPTPGRPGRPSRSTRADLADEPRPQTLSRTSFRIVQEALTNARKHAPGEPVSVRLAGGPGAHLQIEVRNAVQRACPTGARAASAWPA